MAKTLEQMRAELNGDGVLDYFSNLLAPIKAAYTHMPGAPVAQAALGMASDMFGQAIGVPYGIGKQIATGQLTGDPRGTAYAYDQAQQLANKVRYAPPTQAGKDIYEGVNKLPQVVTGSHMGVGPLPELWNANVRLRPDDVRVAGKTAIEDIRNLPMDYANARAGLQREYPTMGSRLANVAQKSEPLVENVVKPLAEKGYEMYTNPWDLERSSASPIADISGMFKEPRMYAVKPKGGNWPTNLGSTLPLKEQGALGEHLSKVQYSDPVAVFENQLQKHYPRGIDNRQLLHNWQEYLHSYLSNNDFDVTKSVNDLKREAADKFAEAYNAGTLGDENIEPIDKKLHTASQIEQALPAYNSWVAGPYQKYITNQMGTGLATDPLLQAVNESGMPPHEIFGQDIPRDWEIDSVTQRAQQRRQDFPDRLFGYSDTPEKAAALENSGIGKITATTPEGVDYETALDASLYPKAPYSFKDQDGGTTKFPVLSKLDRDALITDFLTEPDQRTGFTEIRKKVFRDLLSGDLDTNKLSNVTPATVTRQMIKDKMAEFKEAQLSKKGAADWIPKRAAQMPTDMTFPDGSKMTIITPEMANADEAMTARDLGQITIDLNQCVGAGCHATQDYPGHGPFLVPHTGKPPRGKAEYDKYGYLRRLKNGEIEIASLKDPEGVSQATIELKIDKPKPIPSHQKESTVGFWLEDNKTPADVREFYDNKVAFGIDVAAKMAADQFPELKAKLENAYGAPKKSIVQIKGESNNQVKEEFTSHVVDWLNANADKLTSVRDLGNLLEVHDLDNHYDAIGKLVDDRKEWYSPTVEEFFKKVDDEKLLPRFFTTNQFSALAEQQGVDLSAEPPKQLSPFDKQSISEEMYRILTKDPQSLYLQDNLKDHLVEAMDALLGDRKPEGQIPVDVHGKLVELLLDHSKKNKDLLNSVLAQLADRGPNSWVDGFTEAQRANMLNIMASWFEKNPLEKLPTNEDFDKAVQNHPDPFSEIQFFGQDWNAAPDNYWQHLEGGVEPFSPSRLEQAVRGMEPEPEPQWQPDRPNETAIQHTNRVMRSYLEGQEIDFDHRTPNVRILMGSQAPEARLPRFAQQSVTEMLLDQDNRTQDIRDLLNHLQNRGAEGTELTDPQAENLLNILISWTERYPLNER